MYNTAYGSGSSGNSLIDAVLNSLQGTYREVLRVKRDVANCIHMYDGLHPAADTISLDGATKRLLCLSGTIPIEFGGVVYNFPIEIVVPEAYPFKPPRFRVTPTGNLRIKPQHRHVDDSGLVYHPYLTSWNPSQSNLAELVVQVAIEFGKEPPLYADTSAPPPPPIVSGAGRPGSTRVPPPPYQTQTPPPVYQQKPPPPPPISNVPLPPTRGSASNSSPVPPPPIYSTASSSTIQPTLAVFKNRVLEKLKLRCNNELPKMQKDIQVELENSEKLLANGEELGERLRKLKSLERELSQQLEQVTVKADKLQNWMIEQSDQADAIRANLDEYVQPSDAVAKQLFTCVAESLAIEDMLYHLNSALVRQQIDLKVFLKQTRALSREQFFKIALATKLNQAQMRPAQDAPPYPTAGSQARPAGKGTSSGHYPSVPTRPQNGW